MDNICGVMAKSRLRSVLDEAVKGRVFPGCVVGVVSRAGGRLVMPVGGHTYDAGAKVMTESSVFDIASITKCIPCSTLALKALEEGRVGLEDKLVEWVPEFAGAYRDRVTLWHLLTQTLDHGYALSSCKGMGPDDLLHVLLTRDMRSAPGERFAYANATSILLGMLVERVYGKPLDKLADELLFGPLGMKRTTYSPGEAVRGEVVPTEIDDWRGRAVQGEVHDESAYVLREIMAPGSAGVFSTVPDLLNFLFMLLRDGAVNANQALSPKTIRLIQVNQLERIGKWAALGWELNQLRFMGLHCSVYTIGKTGFTGCMVMCDFEKGEAMAFLSNHTFPKRRNNADVINVVRRDVADIVFGS